MTTEGSFRHEPSQEVLDFLNEEMKLRFPLVKDRHPTTVTTHLQDGSIFVDMWSKDGQWIMSSETANSPQLQKIVDDPQLRAKTLESFARSIREQTK